VVIRQKMRRDRLVELVAQLPVCVNGMEACSGAHDSARKLEASDIRSGWLHPSSWCGIARAARTTPMTPRRSAKHWVDRICAFYRSKSAQRQSILTLHRVHQVFVDERTGTINRIRGLIADFGLALLQRAAKVRRGVGRLLGQWPPAAAPRSMGRSAVHIDFG